MDKFYSSEGLLKSITECKNTSFVLDPKNKQIVDDNNKTVTSDNINN